MYNNVVCARYARAQGVASESIHVERGTLEQ